VLALGLLKAAGFAAGIFLVAWFLFPALLRRLVALRSREVFLLATLATVFGTAFLAGEAGLSLALGAFIAGLVVSESEFSHPMFAEVLPFRDIFNGLFFVSVGMLVERDVLGEHLGEVLQLTLLVLLGKALVVWGTGRLFRLDWRAALLAGVALCQVGEFGLVLTQQATGLGLISATQRSVLITTAVITIGLTPLLVTGFTRMLATPRTELGLPEIPAGEARLADHVIIVGFGINGRNVSNALRELGVRFIVVEMNPLTVAEEGKRGVPIVLGDAARPALLDHLEVRAARTLISAVADAAATRDIVAAARHANPDLHIIARTRYVREIEPLRALGADDVVPEEFETAIELVGRVLHAYGVARPTIEREKKHLRRAQYRALLGEEEEAPITLEELLAEIEVEHLRLADGDTAVGRTFRQLDLRARTGATAVAVIRGDTAIANPDAELALAARDEVVLVGECQTLKRARDVLRSGTRASEGS
jgi:CPA2 family monovalent cation:H+ antiporter-2